MKCHFLKAFGLSGRWRQPITASNQYQKWDIHINSFWLLGLIDIFVLAEVKRLDVPCRLEQTHVNAATTLIQLATFGCSGQPRAHKSGTNSSVSTHDIIIDGSCLRLGHFFPDSWQAAAGWKCYSAAESAAPHAALSSLLYWSSYLLITSRLPRLTTLCATGQGAALMKLDDGCWLPH